MRFNVLFPSTAVLVCSLFMSFSTSAVAVERGTSFHTFTSSPGDVIPDGAYNGALASMACDTIDASEIPAGSTVFDIELETSIDHPWSGDLVLKLQTPDGTILGVMSRPGMDEFNDDGSGCCGNGATLDSAFPIRFFDDAQADANELGEGLHHDLVVCEADDICEFFPNPSSVEQPPSNFADLAGESASGEWTLCIGDAATEDEGVFQSWTLDVLTVETPGLDITPSSIDFGDQEVGVAGPSEVVTIENVGTEDLEIGTLAISGPQETDFALSEDECSETTLEPEETCTFEVTMTASASGPRAAQVDVPSSAPSSPDAVTLAGTGVEDDDGIGITPTSIDFGEVEVGETSAAETVTIENVGTETLQIDPLTIIGDDADAFAISNDTCSEATLEEAETCTFDVEMTPSAPGTLAAQVEISSNAPSSPNLVTLTGSGTDEDDIIFRDRFEGDDEGDL